MLHLETDFRSADHNAGGIGKRRIQRGSRPTIVDDREGLPGVISRQPGADFSVPIMLVEHRRGPPGSVFDAVGDEAEACLA